MLFALTNSEQYWETKIDCNQSPGVSPYQTTLVHATIVSCQVGARHELSAGLLIGGKDVKEERERLGGELNAVPTGKCINTSTSSSEQHNSTSLLVTQSGPEMSNTAAPAVMLQG